MPRSRKYVVSAIAAIALCLPAVTTSAASCKSGKCSSGAAKAAITSIANQVRQTQNRLESSQGGDIKTAYDAIIKIHAEAEKKSVGSLRVVRDQIEALAKEIEKKAADEYASAMEQYMAGDHAAALTRLEKLAECKGLSAARKAESELRKEDSRSEWRELLAQTTKHINAHQFADARKPLSNISRRARSLGYTDQLKEAVASFEVVTGKQIAAAEKDIENAKYDRAYTTLRSISQLTALRSTAAKSRAVLKVSSRIEGMKQAETDYEKARLAERQREEAEKRAKSDKQKELETISSLNSR